MAHAAVIGRRNFDRSIDKNEEYSSLVPSGRVQTNNEFGNRCFSFSLHSPSAHILRNASDICNVEPSSNCKFLLPNGSYCNAVFRNIKPVILKILNIDTARATLHQQLVKYFEK